MHRQLAGIVAPSRWRRAVRQQELDEASDNEGGGETKEEDNSDDDFEVTPARAKSRKPGKRIREEGEEEEEAPKAKKKKDAKKKKEKKMKDKTPPTKTPRARSRKVITRVQPALHTNIECVVHNLRLCTTHSIWAAWHTISDCVPDTAICVPWQPNSLRRDGRLPPWPSPSTCAKPSPSSAVGVPAGHHRRPQAVGRPVAGQRPQDHARPFSVSPVHGVHFHWLPGNN